MSVSVSYETMSEIRDALHGVEETIGNALHDLTERSPSRRDILAGFALAGLLAAPAEIRLAERACPDLAVELADRLLAVLDRPLAVECRPTELPS